MLTRISIETEVPQTANGKAMKYCFKYFKLKDTSVVEDYFFPGRLSYEEVKAEVERIGGRLSSWDTF